MMLVSWSVTLSGQSSWSAVARARLTTTVETPSATAVERSDQSCCASRVGAE